MSSQTKCLLPVATLRSLYALASWSDVDSWSTERLLKKVKDLPAVLDLEDIPEDEEEQIATFKLIQEGLDAEAVFEIASEDDEQTTDEPEVSAEVESSDSQAEGSADEDEPAAEKKADKEPAKKKIRKTWENCALMVLKKRGTDAEIDESFQKDVVSAKGLDEDQKSLDTAKTWGDYVKKLINTWDAI